MRKGQAAMEFLMTYGWAILVVLAAIGALAYFGVLSPDRFLPDKCTGAPPFSCTQYKVTTGEVNVTLSPNAGVDVSIVYMNLTCDGANFFQSVAGAQGIPSGNIVNGNQFTWQIPTTSLDGAAAGEAGCGTFNSGSKFKANWRGSYMKSGESVAHDFTGSIQVRIE
jgi:hypothetical protein